LKKSGPKYISGFLDVLAGWKRWFGSQNIQIIKKKTPQTTTKHRRNKAISNERHPDTK